MEYLETHITNHCNLNCASCTHYAPLAEPWYKDINEYLKEIAQLSFLFGNSLRMFRILGGEPLLHPQVTEFLYAARLAFPTAAVELVTNGTLLRQMPQKFYNTVNTYFISIYLSDYHLDDDIENFLKSNVNLYRIGSKGTFIKPALDLHGSDETKNFIDCMNTFDSRCYNLRDGKIYHCPTEAYYDLFSNYFGTKHIPYTIGIDIFNSTREEIDQYLNTPDEFCKYCDIKNKITIPYGLSQKKASEWLA